MVEPTPIGILSQNAQIESMRLTLAREHQGEHLHGGGGGGTSDGMQERVTRLEKNVDQLTKDVGDLRVDVSAIKENLRHLPTKPWLFTTLLAMLTGLGALIAILIRFLPHA